MNTGIKNKKRILVCPLDWGLGHATRCVPIIRELIKQGAEVVIGADKLPLAFLKIEFPDLEFIKIPGYNIHYPKGGSMVWKTIFSIPGILLNIWKEHRIIRKIIEDHRINAVISDNRFGLWSKRIPCVFITHQVMIKSPFLERLIYRINKRLISFYDECWVPDFPGKNNLSGDLSHRFPLPTNTIFIGPLSRFQSSASQNNNLKEVFKHDLMAIISGPEPQRSIFEKMVLEQIKKINLNAVVVSGIPGSEEKHQDNKNLKAFKHLESETFQKTIMASEIILCRSGYSTIMDLSFLNKKAILVPTPGQTEQEYLGEYYSKKGLAICCLQKEFDLELALLKKNTIGSLGISHPNSDLLLSSISSFMKKI